jgi:malonate-semialdehyde dehydrogenase (acetylating)/methylmalonate-semialdehyde dehydrogenase
MSTLISEAKEVAVTPTKEGSAITSYIAGAWDAPRRATSHPIVNPANGETLATLPYGGAAEVDQAAKDAHRAWLSWREVPVVDRVQPLYRFKALLEKNVRELGAILTRENGKTLEDAMTEVKRGIQMVEVACGMPSLMMGDSMNDVAKGIDCRTIRQPIGVCAGITPFNFPAMVPLWMYPFAIAAGNTFILKPSERVPMTPTRVVELLLEAGLPAGVIQLVHGGREVV